MTNDLIASFEYDENGNRKKLTYSLDGTPSSTVYIDYSYNRDNLLTYFSTTGGPTFTLYNVTVDGLGRLTDANETISKTSGTVDYSYTYVYDMRSQLTEADITKDGSPWWDGDYNYYKNGNLKDRTTDISKTEFEYTGDIMDGTKTGGGETFTLTWDENGNMIDVNMSTGDDTTLEYNWDSKLRSATKGSASISLRYDPDGNRIFKDSSESGERKYIVDIAGDLPVILMELDSADNMDIMKKYIYAHSQILAQHDIDDDDIPAKDDIYFYLHDRLGSVRQVIDTSGGVKNRYIYNPFGELYPAPDFEETVDNPFKFTGQYFDSEIDEYYLRARQYDPHIARFTARDPVFGKFKEPLTLHVYLYCLNDPVNRVDLSGELSTGDVLVSASINSALYGMQAWMQGVRGWGLLRPMMKGAILGAGASVFSAGLQAKWATNVIKGLESSAARGMLTAGARSMAGELFDSVTDPDYEFNLAKSFTNLGVAMGMGGGKALFMGKFLSHGTFGGEGFVFGQKNLEEAFQAFYRWIRLAQSEAIGDLYE